MGLFGRFRAVERPVIYGQLPRRSDIPLARINLVSPRPFETVRGKIEVALRGFIDLPSSFVAYAEFVRGKNSLKGRFDAARVEGLTPIIVKFSNNFNDSERNPFIQNPVTLQTPDGINRQINANLRAVFQDLEMLDQWERAIDEEVARNSTQELKNIDEAGRYDVDVLVIGAGLHASRLASIVGSNLKTLIVTEESVVGGTLRNGPFALNNSYGSSSRFPFPLQGGPTISPVPNLPPFENGLRLEDLTLGPDRVLQVDCKPGDMDASFGERYRIYAGAEDEARLIETALISSGVRIAVNQHIDLDERGIKIREDGIKEVILTDIKTGKQRKVYAKQVVIATGSGKEEPSFTGGDLFKQAEQLIKTNIAEAARNLPRTLTLEMIGGLYAYWVAQGRPEDAFPLAPLFDPQANIAVFGYGDSAQAVAGLFTGINTIKAFFPRKLLAALRNRERANVTLIAGKGGDPKAIRRRYQELLDEKETKTTAGARVVGVRQEGKKVIVRVVRLGEVLPKDIYKTTAKTRTDAQFGIRVYYPDGTSELIPIFQNQNPKKSQFKDTFSFQKIRLRKKDAQVAIKDGSGNIKKVNIKNFGMVPVGFPVESLQLYEDAYDYVVNSSGLTPVNITKTLDRILKQVKFLRGPRGIIRARIASSFRKSNQQELVSVARGTRNAGVYAIGPAAQLKTDEFPTAIASVIRELGITNNVVAAWALGPLTDIFGLSLLSIVPRRVAVLEENGAPRDGSNLAIDILQTPPFLIPDTYKIEEYAAQLSRLGSSRR